MTRDGRLPLIPEGVSFLFRRNDIGASPGDADADRPKLAAIELKLILLITRERAMKPLAVAVIVAFMTAVGAAYVLETSWQSNSAESFATEGARVGDPGHNLVGFGWQSGRS